MAEGRVGLGRASQGPAASAGCPLAAAGTCGRAAVELAETALRLRSRSSLELQVGEASPPLHNNLSFSRHLNKRSDPPRQLNYYMVLTCPLRFNHSRSRMMASGSARRWAVLALLVAAAHTASAQFDYADALQKSILFLEAQRSGPLPGPSSPRPQRMGWRGDSALTDGFAPPGMLDLVGGYYDSGDNVKFNFPMAFSITTLAYNVIEYRAQLQQAGQLDYALDAIRWGTDYLLKCHSAPTTLWGEVGEGQSDHSCWARPEQMKTPRTPYQINQTSPGTELAAETAAAMAAASIAFQSSDPTYATTLSAHAQQLFTFGDSFRGDYAQSISVVSGFYNSFSGYKDELLWAAAWLWWATGKDTYLQYCVDNAASFGGTTMSKVEFSWDDKMAGAQILLTKILLQNKAAPAFQSTLATYRLRAEDFVCAVMQAATTGQQVQRTPAGLIYVREWSNLQYAGSATMLITIYADYLAAAGQSLTCGTRSFSPGQILAFAKTQVDYVLGNNPLKLSYMVGFSSNYPTMVHHRGASTVSIFQDPEEFSCNDGFNKFYYSKANIYICLQTSIVTYTYHRLALRGSQVHYFRTIKTDSDGAHFRMQGPNPNVLIGSIIGGPDAKDGFVQSRQNFMQCEPSTYLNTVIVGPLAKINDGAVPSSPANFTLPSTIQPANPPPPPPSPPPSPPPGSGPLPPPSPPLPPPPPPSPSPPPFSPPPPFPPCSPPSPPDLSASPYIKTTLQPPPPPPPAPLAHNCKNPAHCPSLRSPPKKGGHHPPGVGHRVGHHPPGVGHHHRRLLAGPPVAASPVRQEPLPWRPLVTREEMARLPRVVVPAEVAAARAAMEEEEQPKTAKKQQNLLVLPCAAPPPPSPPPPVPVPPGAPPAPGSPAAGLGETGNAQVSVLTTTSGSWGASDGGTFTNYEVTVTNLGAQPITSIGITCTGFSPTGSWGITQAGTICMLPSYVFPLAPGTKFSFGYIQENTPALFQVSSVGL
eukprot:SM000042S15369  [mRNA]  locus=s42:650347:655660:+ [translate_table: standard]